MPRPIVPERSQTTLQFGAGPRPGPATTLASRRSQSVSNPVDVPSASDLLRSNTSLGRSKSSRLVRNPTAGAGVMPLRVKTPHGTAGGVTSVDMDGSRAGARTPVSGASTTLRPNLRRPRGREVPPVPPLSVPQSPPQSVQPGQFMNATQGETPLVLPAVPTSAQGEWISLSVIPRADVLSFQFPSRGTPDAILQHVYGRLHQRSSLAIGDASSSDCAGEVARGIDILSTTAASAPRAATAPCVGAISVEFRQNVKQHEFELRIEWCVVVERCERRHDERELEHGHGRHQQCGNTPAKGGAPSDGAQSDSVRRGRRGRRVRDG